MRAAQAVDWSKQLYWSTIPGIRDEKLPFTKLYVHRHSEPSEHLRNLVEAEMLKIKEIRNKKYRIYLTDSMQPRVYGGFFFNPGPEIQFPLRFSFTDVEHMRRQGAHIEIDLGYANQRRKLEVNSDICQEMFGRIILSESAKRFIVQRELQIANSGTIFTLPMIVQAVVFTVGSIFLPLLRPFLGGALACVTAIAISSTAYIGLRTNLDRYLVKKADNLVIQQFPEYIDGARDYFANELKLNRLLRRIMGNEGEKCIQLNGESKLDIISIQSRLKEIDDAHRTLTEAQ